MLPKVTIVIPFYNDPYIDQAIVSALNQTYEHLEIIVVDDGSTVHQEKITPFLERIHYIGKANGGTASALNYGIRMSSGEYIVWLSSDDLFYPHKIARQVEFMLQHRSSISHTAFDLINELSQVVEPGVGARYPSMREFVRSFHISNPVNGCTVMLRRDLLDRIGWFNEKQRFTQDYDLWVRALLAGVTIHYLDESLTMYRWHGQMGTMLNQPRIQKEVRMVQMRYRKRLRRLVRSIHY
ncbi:MAG: glycosyl transferase [Paenibacillaceae bacterium]|jgi:glycosyltransferase involved in cell wall biosynthesis|nr:glycosyl transferase [Paenibacillaceae bacterium]